MWKFVSRMIAVAVAASASAGGAVAAPPAEPPASIAAAAQPPTPIADVVVVGRRPVPAPSLKTVDAFVSSISVMTAADQLARWRRGGPTSSKNLTADQSEGGERGVCPIVIGLPVPYADFIVSRVREVASAVGAPVDRPQCRGFNLEVLFPTEPAAFHRELAARTPGLFGFRYHAALVADLKAPETPIHAWYATRVSATGNPFSRVSAAHVSAIANALVIVDAGSTQTVNMGQLSDYIAVVGLGAVKPDAAPKGAATILNLFHDLDAGRVPAAGLTPWDMAYLKALYGVGGNQPGWRQNHQIATRMVSDLKPR
jgi:hypothetical protein